MDFNKVFTFNTNIFKVNDSEYRKKIEKSLRKLSKVLINDSFLGYESTMSHIENFTRLLEQHKIDYNKYFKPNYDKLKKIEKGFLFNENGFTTGIEGEVYSLIQKVNKLLKDDNYEANNESKDIFIKIESKLKEFVLETNLADKRTRKNYQKKIALIKELLDSNTFISLVTILAELNDLEDIKKENTINYQNLYLRNVNRYETIKDEFDRVKSYFTTKEKEVLDLQYKDVEKLLNSESYHKFDNASDILDIIEEKFKSAISGKKDRIIKYLTTEVDGFVGYIWSEDLEVIRKGSEFIIAEAEKSNNFNDLNLDKFKIDEKVNSKKSTIDAFVKFLVDSSSGTRREQKAKLSNIIKKSETFFQRDVSHKEFEEFVIKSKNILEGRKPEPSGESKNSNSFKVILLIAFLIPSIFLMFYNQSKSEEYDAGKGRKYLDYIAKLAKITKKTGEELNKNEIRKRIFVPKDDLNIVTLTDSTVTINYKGNLLKSKF